MKNSRVEHLEDTDHGTTLIYFYSSTEEKNHIPRLFFKDQSKLLMFLNSAQRAFIMQTLCFKTCIKSSDVRWGKLFQMSGLRHGSWHIKIVWPAHYSLYLSNPNYWTLLLVAPLYYSKPIWLLSSVDDYYFILFFFHKTVHSDHSC